MTNVVVNEDSIVIDQTEGNKVSLELLDEAIPFKLNQNICYHKHGLYDEYMNNVTYIKSANPYHSDYVKKNIDWLFKKRLPIYNILANIGEIVYNYNNI